MEANCRSIVPAGLPTSISTCGVVATNFGIERFWTDMDFRKAEKHAVADQADWHMCSSIRIAEPLWGAGDISESIRQWLA